MTFLKIKPFLISTAVAGAVLMMGAPQMAAAQSSPELTGLMACQAISNAEAQLACFQIETTKLRGGSRPFSDPVAPPVLPSPVVPVVPAPAVSETDRLALERDSLAAEKARLKAEEARLDAEKDRLAAEQKRLSAEKKDAEAKTKRQPRNLAIASTSRFGPNRYIRFTLENGEVWQQTETASVRLGKSDGPDMLELKPKSFGSYIGQVNGKSRRFRVKQIR